MTQPKYYNYQDPQLCYNDDLDDLQLPYISQHKTKEDKANLVRPETDVTAEDDFAAAAGSCWNRAGAVGAVCGEVLGKAVLLTRDCGVVSGMKSERLKALKASNVCNGGSNPHTELANRQHNMSFVSSEWFDLV